MSPSSYRQIKLNINQVNKLLGELAKKGFPVIISGHAQLRFKERNLTLVDTLNILLSPIRKIREGEFKDGSYRYQVETNKIGVVISFNDLGTKVIIVTVFRKG